MTTKIEDLKEYHRNPRKISTERFEHLSASLKKLGDLGGIIVNRPTQEIIGGNQRTKTFLQEREKFTIKLTEGHAVPRQDGTIAYGYVIRDEGTPQEQRFSYREVIWTEEQCEEANIVANKVTGMWDFDILANKFDTEKLLSFGFSQQDLDLLPKTVVPGMDNEGLTKNLDSYLEGNIKQIVLFFKADEFDGIVGRLDKIMAHYKVESHTEAFIKMLEQWEHANPQA